MCLSAHGSTDMALSSLRNVPMKVLGAPLNMDLLLFLQLNLTQ